MRAVGVRAFHGEPELLTVPVPAPSSDELLVRVSRAGVNPFDWKIADGLYEGRRAHRFPLILGVDAVGVVAAVPAGETRFQPGDRIFGQFLHDPIGAGTYAEQTTAPAAGAVAKLPSSISDDVGAALPTAGMTALDAVNSLGLHPGERLVVVGAGGGVGGFAVRLGHARNAFVIAVTGADAAASLPAMGADEVVLRGADPPVEEIRERYPSGVDALLDVASDGARFASYASLVRPGGRAASSIGAADLPHLRARGVHGINIDLHPTSSLLEELVGEATRNSLALPRIERWALERGPEAIALSRAGRVHGKLVLRP